VLPAGVVCGVHASHAAAIGFYEGAGFGKLDSREFDAGGPSDDDNIMGMPQ
jgi:ribosomal protein S18 acetylase RimI-like enzyme